MEKLDNEGQDEVGVEHLTEYGWDGPNTTVAMSVVYAWFMTDYISDRILQ